MKKLFATATSLVTSVIFTIIGFKVHHDSNSKVSEYIKSPQDGVELGLMWGVVIAVFFAPVIIYTFNIKQNAVLWSGLSCVALAAFSYFITPYFYLMSQIA